MKVIIQVFEYNSFESLINVTKERDRRLLVTYVPMLE